MLSFFLQFIADWIKERGSAALTVQTSSFFRKPIEVKDLQNLFYQVFFDTLERYILNPVDTKELPILRELYDLKQEDGSSNKAKKEILLTILSGYQQQNIVETRTQNKVIDFLAGELCRQNVLKNIDSGKLALILENALALFPLNFYQSLSEKQGNFILLERVSRLSHTLVQIEELSRKILSQTKVQTGNEKLLFMLLVPTITEINSLQHAQIPPEKYGNTPLDWKPFGQKTLAAIFTAIGQKYMIEILPLWELSNLPQIALFKCQKRKIIMIVDSIIFKLNNVLYQNIIQHIDDCNVGGIILYDYTHWQEIEALKTENMPFLAFYNTKPHYSFIEWNVASDNDFTKRIQQMAVNLANPIATTTAYNNSLGTY